MRQLFLLSLFLLVCYLLNSAPLFAETKFKTYRNDQGHFELSYPVDWKIQDTEQGRRWNLPTSYFKGTNISEAYFKAGILSDVTADECLKESRSFGARSEEVTFNGKVFEFVDSGEPAMSSLYVTKAYYTVHNDHCFQLALMIHSVSLGASPHNEDCADPNYYATPEGMKDCSIPRMTYDPAPFGIMLYHIVSTLKFTD